MNGVGVIARFAFRMGLPRKTVVFVCTRWLVLADSHLGQVMGIGA